MIRQIKREHPETSIRQLCQLLRVNRRWFYARQSRLSRSEREQPFRERLEQLTLDFPGYGYRRVTAALKREGWKINHKRVLRIMREEGLLCRPRRGFVRTTDSKHSYPVYPNLVKGLELEAPNVVWVADITYIRLPRGFVYLATILDSYSRKCIGWKLSKHIDAQLALDALEHALATREVRPGLIHHSDRGVQYASNEYVRRLSEVGMRISMSARGNPYDNPKAERFFRTVKYEEVYLKQYQTFEEAEANLRQFIEDAYNEKRLHSSLGDVPPVEFELAYVQAVRC
jgi:transposase InsO family protein